MTSWVVCQKRGGAFFFPCSRNSPSSFRDDIGGKPVEREGRSIRLARRVWITDLRLERGATIGAGIAGSVLARLARPSQRKKPFPRVCGNYIRRFPVLMEKPDMRQESVQYLIFLQVPPWSVVRRGVVHRVHLVVVGEGSGDSDIGREAK